MIFCRIEASDAASHRNLLIAIAHTRNWGEEKALKLIEQGADLAQRMCASFGSMRAEAAAPCTGGQR